MTYYHDLETGHIVLESSRSEWLALPEETRRELKTAFRFHRSRGEWRSKATRNTVWAKEAAKRAGFEYRGTEGEELTRDERRERAIERSEGRADYLEAKAERQHEQAAASFKKADDLVKHIPLGQPILVGHHSERGHRRTIERCHKAGFKGLEQSREAERTEHRAAGAARNAERLRRQMTDRRYLTKKWKEARKRYNRAKAGLEASENGKDVRYGNHAGAVVHGAFEWFKRDYTNGTDRTREEWQAILAENARIYARQMQEAADDMAYWQGYLDQLPESKAWTREKLKAREPAPELVKYRGIWYPIKRINGKSVTVSNWLGVDTLEWKVPYEEISGILPAEAA